jgi:hypothetical protein
LADRATDPDVAEALLQTVRDIDAAIAVLTEQDN